MTDSGEYQRFLQQFDSNVESPMWIGERIYFLAEAGGVNNLHSVSVQGDDLQQHTFHTGLHARQAASDGHRIIYQRGGDLILFDLDKNVAEVLSFVWRGPRSHSSIHYLRNPSEHVENILLHPKGHSCAVMLRGRAFEMPLQSGPAVECFHPLSLHCMCYLFDGRLLLIGALRDDCDTRKTIFMKEKNEDSGTNPGRTESVRTDERCLPVRVRAVLFSGEDVKHAVEVPLPSSVITTRRDDVERPFSASDPLNPTSTSISASPAPHTSSDTIASLNANPNAVLGIVKHLIASPCSYLVAVENKRSELLLLDISSPISSITSGTEASSSSCRSLASVFLVDYSDIEEGIDDTQWSADGSCLAYVKALSRYASVIRVYNIFTHVVINITDGHFKDSLPTFDSAGKYIYFASARDLEPVADEVLFDYGFPKAQGLYAVALQQGLKSPFMRDPRAPGRDDSDTTSEEESEESSDDDESGESEDKSSENSGSSRDSEETESENEKKSIKHGFGKRKPGRGRGTESGRAQSKFKQSRTPHVQLQSKAKAQSEGKVSQERQGKPLQTPRQPQPRGSYDGQDNSSPRNDAVASIPQLTATPCAPLTGAALKIKGKKLMHIDALGIEGLLVDDNTSSDGDALAATPGVGFAAPSRKLWLMELVCLNSQ